MRNRFWSGVCLVGFLVLGTGCSSPPSDIADDQPDPTVNPATNQGQAGGSAIDVPAQVLWSAGPDRNIRRQGQMAIPSLGNAGANQLSEDELPNNIMLATCETEPDEVAVPLNAFDDRYCDTVQAIAYRSDDTGSYAVSAEYTWSIVDESVASIHPLPGQEHAGIQRPSAAYDILWTEDQAQEPTTVVMVCAQPKGGWPDVQHPPLCRTLPLFDVINLDGAWCFSGTTFQDNCDDTLQVSQDGRFLQIAPDGQGVLYGLHVHFYRGDYFYQAEISAHDAMAGTVEEASTHEVIGNWQAWHLPLP